MHIIRNQLVLLATVLLLLVPTQVESLTRGVQCKDENGKSVDWWFIYKMPNGFNYAYYDSKSTSGKLVPSTDTLDCTTGCALGSTLHQLYSAKSSLAHVLYNDEPLGDSKDTTSGPNGGHVKGVMAADKNGGFWLIHSVPKFPDLGPSSFTWTASTIYGQSFMCISLDEDGIEAAAVTLQYMDPNLYDSAIPTALKSTFPQMTALYGGARQVGSNVVTITSSGGTKFTHFAKDNTWGQDLYDDLVEPYFKTPFQWETWRRSPFLPSICNSKYDTMNVASISIGTYQFSYTQDHSKWGVSLNKGSYACVGGINRMQSQRSRGGGTMCLTDSDFWKALSGTVASTESCGGVKSVSDSDPPVKGKPIPKKPTPKPKSPKPKAKSPKPVNFKPVKIAPGPAPGRHGATGGKSRPVQSERPQSGPKLWPTHGKTSTTAKPVRHGYGQGGSAAHPKPVKAGIHVGGGGGGRVWEKPTPKVSDELKVTPSG